MTPPGRGRAHSHRRRRVVCNQAEPGRTWPRRPGLKWGELHADWGIGRSRGAEERPVGATETSDVETAPLSPRHARNDAVVHDLEEPLGELVRALQRRQLYRLVSEIEPPDHELLGRARSLVHDLQTVLAELLDRPVAPTDPREWHDTMSIRAAFEDAAASARDALGARGVLID